MTLQYIDMVVNPLDNLFDIGNNFDKVRSHSLALSAYRPKSPSLSLSNCEEEYYIRVKRVCDRIDKDNSITSASSIQKLSMQPGRVRMVKLVRQLTTLIMHINNMCQMRIWPLTNHLETTCSIFNWTMTLIRLWIQSLGMVSFVLFLCMDPWNTWCLISRTSKILSIGCTNTSWVNLLMKETLIISKT